MKHFVFYFLVRPKLLIHALKCKLSDKYAIEEQWAHSMDYPLNLKNPQTFCEKLQWIKLHDHDPLYHILVDKYEVKQYVAEKIGSQFVVKTLALYKSVDEIDLDKLPNQFVLKCTHDSGSIVICTDKTQFDMQAAKEKLGQGIATTDYYRNYCEWAYKGVKPRIIAEEYIDTLGKPESIEYKITCINGMVKMITVCSGIAHVEFEKRFNDHFDREGNRLPFYVAYKPAGLNLPPQEEVDEMIEICDKLSAGIPQVRVDLYRHKGQLYFGEMTFYTWAGFMNYVPKEYDKIMGDWLTLPKL